MDIIVTSYGTRIHQSGERLILIVPKSKETKTYPARQVEKIVISRASSISSSAVALAMKYNIDVVYLGNFGHPIARIVPSQPKAVPGLRQSQLVVTTDSEKKFQLAKAFVFGKVKNQLAFLMYLQTISGHNFLPTIGEMEIIAEKINNQPITYEQLLGLEGKIAEKYFSSLKVLHPFPGRTPEGRDSFNSALNYGYGVLYNEIEKACLYIGLDPYVGLYHTDRYGKPALVLDLIEEWRVPVVDSIVFPLFWQKRITARKHFTQIKKSEYFLSDSGKKILMTALYERLNKIIFWEDKHQPIKDIITGQVRQLAQFFTDKKTMYQPFIMDNYE